MVMFFLGVACGAAAVLALMAVLCVIGGARLERMREQASSGEDEEER